MPHKKDIWLILAVLLAALLVFLISKGMPKETVEGRTADVTMAPDAIEYIDPTEKPASTEPVQTATPAAPERSAEMEPEGTTPAAESAGETAKPEKSPETSVPAAESAEETVKPEDSPEASVPAAESAEETVKPEDSPEASVPAAESAEVTAEPEKSPEASVPAAESAEETVKPEDSPEVPMPTAESSGEITKDAGDGPAATVKTEMTPEPEKTKAPAAGPMMGPMPEQPQEPVKGHVIIMVQGRQYGDPIPMDRDKIITVRQDANTINRIHITRDSVHMESSTCENQDCIGEGAVTLENYQVRLLGTYIVCMPNGVIVQMIPASEPEAGK